MKRKLSNIATEKFICKTLRMMFQFNKWDRTLTHYIRIFNTASMITFIHLGNRHSSIPIPDTQGIVFEFKMHQSNQLCGSNLFLFWWYFASIGSGYSVCFSDVIGTHFLYVLQIKCAVFTLLIRDKTKKIWETIKALPFTIY